MRIIRKHVDAPCGKTMILSKLAVSWWAWRVVTMRAMCLPQPARTRTVNCLAIEDPLISFDDCQSSAASVACRCTGSYTWDSRNHGTWWWPCRGSGSSATILAWCFGFRKTRRWQSRHAFQYPPCGTPLDGPGSGLCGGKVRSCGCILGSRRSRTLSSRMAGGSSWCASLNRLCAWNHSTNSQDRDKGRFRQSLSLSLIDFCFYCKSPNLPGNKDR